MLGARARPGRARDDDDPPQQTSTVTNPLTATSPLSTAKARSNEAQVIALFLDYPKVADWLKRYPPKPTTDATFKQGVWTVNVFDGRAGEIATGRVDDASGAVTEAWTGPQVAWRMARGYSGAFGGAKINSYPVWLAFCALFLLGLVDWRRLLSIRNADLVVLLSFSVSLWFFNHGHVFAAMSLAYPPLAWLLLRCLWIARRDTPVARDAGLARLAARGGDGVRRRLSHRSQRARVERDRRRLLGDDRRRPDRARPEPLRTLPGRGSAAEVRSRRHRRRGARPDPDERQVRDREPARGHLRAGLLPRVHPGLRDLRLEPQVGRAARRCT